MPNQNKELINFLQQFKEPSDLFTKGNAEQICQLASGFKQADLTQLNASSSQTATFSHQHQDPQAFQYIDWGLLANMLESDDHKTAQQTIQDTVDAALAMLQHAAQTERSNLMLDMLQKPTESRCVFLGIVKNTNERTRAVICGLLRQTMNAALSQKPAVIISTIDRLIQKNTLPLEGIKLLYDSVADQAKQKEQAIAGADSTALANRERLLTLLNPETVSKQAKASSSPKAGNSRTIRNNFGAQSAKNKSQTKTNKARHQPLKPKAKTSQKRPAIPKQPTIGQTPAQQKNTHQPANDDTLANRDNRDLSEEATRQNPSEKPLDPQPTVNISEEPSDPQPAVKNIEQPSDQGNIENTNLTKTDNANKERKHSTRNKSWYSRFISTKQKQVDAVTSWENLVKEAQNKGHSDHAVASQLSSRRMVRSLQEIVANENTELLEKIFQLYERQPPRVQKALSRQLSGSWFSRNNLLLQAVQSGNYDLAKLVLEQCKKTNVLARAANLRNREGQNALNLAGSNKWDDLAEEIENSRNIKHTNNEIEDGPSTKRTNNTELELDDLNNEETERSSAGLGR